MKINKTLIILSLLLIFCISLGAVSAAEDADISVNDNTDNVATVESSVNVDAEISTVSAGEIHDSSEIVDDIESATGTYNIKNDYQINMLWQIPNANVIIEGNNHTIYGNGKQAFRITGNNVIIKNLNFVNCSTSSGGAISFIDNGNCFVSDCSFVGCSATDGGAILFRNSNNCFVSGCSFVNCSASMMGGAILARNSSNLSVNYCVFDNNKADQGSAIKIDSGNGNVDYNFFAFQNNVPYFPKNLVNGIIPKKWVVLDISKFNDVCFVNFVLNMGTLSKAMPNYKMKLSINGNVKDINVKINSYYDTYTNGNYLLTSPNSGNVLANFTFNNNRSMNVSVNDTLYGEPVSVVVTLPTDAIGYVELYINDKYYGDSGVRGGVATFNLSNLNPGTYDIDLVYTGNYVVTRNSKSFTVTAKTVNITLSPITNYTIFSGENYTVTFTSGGEAIDGAKVIFELVNGDIKKNYTVYTNSEGKASLPINLAYTGEYGFNIYFNNTGYEYTVINQTILVTVGNATFIDNFTDKTFNSTSMSGENFTIQLVNGNGKGITGVYVDLDFKKGQNGTIVTYKIKTDSEGKVRLPLNLKYAGDYYLTAKYENISEDYTINILPKSTSNPSDKPTVLTNNYNDEFVTTPNSGAEIVKLTSKNVPIESAIITSNNNGEAKLAINLSDVGNIIKAIFEGNNIYAPSDESITSVEIKDTL